MGLGEEEAKRKGVPHRVFRAAFAHNDRAICDGTWEDNFAKVLVDPKGKILGATIVHPHAGDLLGEIVLAKKNGLPLSALASVIHAYPSLSEIHGAVGPRVPQDVAHARAQEDPHEARRVPQEIAMDDVSAAPAGPAAKKPFPVAKVALAVVVVAGLFLLFRLLPIAAWIEEFKTYVRGQGALGYLIFGLVYIGASLIPGGPAAIMTLAAGAVYGVVTGTILVSLSSITAATLAFLLARGAFRQRVQKIAERNKTFGSLNRAIEKEGARIVALVRLSPVFPFTIVNYLFGLTPVKLASYFFASWIAMLPGTLAYVYFGSALGDVTGSATTLQKTIKISLAVAAVVATIFIARIAAKAIKSAGVEEAKAPRRPDLLDAVGEDRDVLDLRRQVRDVVEEERRRRRGAVPFEGGERAVPLADLVHPPELPPEEPRHENAVEAPVRDDQRGARSRGAEPREKAVGPDGGVRGRLPSRGRKLRLARPPSRSHARDLLLDLPVEGPARPDAPVELDEVGIQRHAEAERSRHDGRGFASPDQRAGPHGVDLLAREADREILRLTAPTRRKRRVEAGALQRAGEIALALAMAGDPDEHETGFYEKRVPVSSRADAHRRPRFSRRGRSHLRRRRPRALLAAIPRRDRDLRRARGRRVLEDPRRHRRAPRARGDAGRRRDSCSIPHAHPPRSSSTCSRSWPGASIFLEG